jgi:hypothetical protein
MPRDMKSVAVIFFLFITIKLTAPDLKEFLITRTEPADVYGTLFRAMVQVESAGNANAFNLIEEATGPLQIRPIRLLDYNERTGSNYLLEDCYDLEVSKEIFLYYAKRIGYPNYESIARSWNGSGRKTIEYWKKVSAYL